VTAAAPGPEGFALAAPSSAAWAVAPAEWRAPAPIADPVERVARAWQALDAVLDPEVPVVSVRELGIVREVEAEGVGVAVVLTPTYSGCPATEVIEDAVRQALEAAGVGPVVIRRRRAPAWTTDWITAEGRRKLLAYGIVPPEQVGAGDAAAARSALPAHLHAGAVPIRFMPRRAAASLLCPRCGSADTERLSAFGSTACKALHRCRACGEPFEHFKPI
jgi:ring-1,2-phenylacetyl-CoA epoxidase subunit PaaD